MAFKRAIKKKSKLRLALIGPSGSGKTYSALAIASGLGQKIAVIDTEGGSASLYASEFTFDEDTLKTFHPKEYISRLKEAEEEGYDVVIIDSLSHAWFGQEGALELVNKETLRSKSHNSQYAWRNVTPLHNALVNAIIQSKCHVIATMRAKEKYVQEQDSSGKTHVKKLGMEAIQREGLGFEFTFTGDMDMDHNLIINKTRMASLDGAIIHKPDKKFSKQLLDWLDSGEVIEEEESAPEEEPKPTPPPTPKPKKPAAKAISTPEVDSTVANPVEVEAQIPEKSQKVASLIEKVYNYLRSVSLEDPEETIYAANLVICSKFEVESPLDIPEELFTDFHKYLQTDLLALLRSDKFIK